MIDLNYFHNTGNLKYDAHDILNSQAAKDAGFSLKNLSKAESTLQFVNVNQIKNVIKSQLTEENIFNTRQKWHTNSIINTIRVIVTCEQTQQLVQQELERQLRILLSPEIAWFKEHQVCQNNQTVKNLNLEFAEQINRLDTFLDPDELDHVNLEWINGFITFASLTTKSVDESNKSDQKIFDLCEAAVLLCDRYSIVCVAKISKDQWKQEKDVLATNLPIISSDDYKLLGFDQALETVDGNYQMIRVPMIFGPVSADRLDEIFESMQTNTNGLKL